MNIIISSTSIKQDAAGRFCLNDLHHASGGEKRHQPYDWLRQQQTQELIAEIEKEKPGIPGISSKQRLGTFVCRELVYAYAMWISPAFHLKVIRVFDKVATQPQKHVTADTGMTEYRKARALDMASKAAERTCSMFPNLCDESKMAICAGFINVASGTQIIALPKLEERHYSATKVGERFGVSRNKVGIIANTHHLKTPEYGMYVLEKAEHSDKQVEAFKYNERGMMKIGELLQTMPAVVALHTQGNAPVAGNSRGAK